MLSINSAICWKTRVSDGTHPFERRSSENPIGADNQQGRLESYSKDSPWGTLIPGLTTARSMNETLREGEIPGIQNPQRLYAEHSFQDE